MHLIAIHRTCIHTVVLTHNCLVRPIQFVILFTTTSVDTPAVPQLAILATTFIIPTTHHLPAPPQVGSKEELGNWPPYRRVVLPLKIKQIVCIY